MLIFERRKTEIFLAEDEKEILKKAGEILDRILINAERSEEYIRVGSDSWGLDILESMANGIDALSNEEVLELETPEEADS